MAKDRGIDLLFEQKENVPLVDINQESIERVIINLLTNAIKYTPSGGTISVIVELVDNATNQLKDEEAKEKDAVKLPDLEVAVHIRDTGIGIPEDALENVFDRFFRVEKKVHTIKGTGLGLTICKKIIEKHKGRLGVVSAIGEGSTFSFFIPLFSFDDEEFLDIPDEFEDENNGSDIDSGVDVETSLATLKEQNAEAKES